MKFPAIVPAIVYKKRLARWALMSLIVLTILLPYAFARAEYSPAQKQEIEAIIKDYLVNHPEVLAEAIASLEKNQRDQEDTDRQQTVKSNQDAIFNSPHAAIVGNPAGKVTLVEYFDYNCGYCKAALPDMQKLIDNNPDLRIVLKDFPVLGPDSVAASQVAIAVRQQLSGDKFWAYHTTLLSTRGKVGKARALEVAKDFNVNMDQLDKDLNSPEYKSSLKEVMAEGDLLKLTGTPSFVVIDNVVVGAVGYKDLNDTIQNIKKCGKSDCSG